jgi:uncharacterized protein YheU (UPF0270 family)
MRTKTLLIAAAAMVAGVITSQAQPVYSQNIVGYVNQQYPSGQYVQQSAPLANADGTNGVEDLYPNIQTGDAVLIWNVNQFETYTYFGPGQWLYPDQVTIGVGPNLNVGTGFFYLAGVTETNTFVGTVILTNPPVSFPSGRYVLVGSTPPIATSSLEDTNLNLPLQVGDAVLIWQTNQYATYTYFGPGQWLYPDQVTIGVSPALGVGAGFFYLAGVSETWTQNFKLQ